MTGSNRVAHVTTAHPARDNRIFHKECAALARAGFDVHLVAVAERDERVADVAITALPRRSERLGRMVLGPLDAWLALRRIRPDLIHVHDPELIPLAILWRLLRRRPAVYDAHEDLAKQVTGKGYLPRHLRPLIVRAAALVEWLADQGLSGVVAATPAIARNFTKAHVTLVQNFPWTASFPPPEAIRHAQMDAVYVGALSEGRGLQQMLTLAAATSSDGAVVLAGPAAPEHRAAMSQAGGVHYVGTVPAADVPGLLAVARLGLAVLHPLDNYLEAQATKIYEYMAAGRPFVASAFPAWVQQLGHHGCGIFVDPLDDQSIASAVATLRTDLELARLMGRRGRRAWEQHFTFEPEASRLVAMTTGLLS